MEREIFSTDRKTFFDFIFLSKSKLADDLLRRRLGDLDFVVRPYSFGSLALYNSSKSSFTDIL